MVFNFKKLKIKIKIFKIKGAILVIFFIDGYFVKNLKMLFDRIALQYKKS